MAKIVFLGTPDFALPSLEALLKLTDCQLTLVITQANSPIAQAAAVHRLPLSYNLNDLKKVKADLAVVVAYGRLIPSSLLALPRLGFLNLHPSLLPKYRGPSPIQFALLNNDRQTGVTVMQLDAGMDTGPLLAQETVAISPSDDYLSLSAKLAKQGAALLTKIIPGYLANKLQPRAQKIDKKTITKIIKRTDGRVDLSKDQPSQIINKLRAFTPWPGIYTFYKNKRLKIIKAHLANERLILDTVQLEGKRPISYQEFKNGYSADIF